MFKIGDKVFDNERGYGEGVISTCDYNVVFVDFTKGMKHSYNLDGRWACNYSITLFKKEEMKNYYYVGQKVSHQSWGNGEIIALESTQKKYPIVVDFGDNHKFFTTDGRYNETELPSLSQKPHVPLELEEVVSFEKEELVWYKNGDNWIVRYYSHKDGDYHIIFDNQKKNGKTYPVKEVRKFSDNPLV